MKLLTRTDLDRETGVTWLVEGWIPDKALGLIYAESESYKSFFVIDAICSLATGTDFLGQPTVPGAVVYIATEGHHGVKDRVRACEVAHDTKVPDQNVRFLLEAVARDDPDEVDRLRELLEAEMAGAPLRLIVADTVSGSLQNGDQNSNTDMARLVRLVERLARHFGAAGLLVHHNTSDEPRGGKALRCNTSYR
jgi:RecA-family ATPase